MPISDTHAIENIADWPVVKNLETSIPPSAICGKEWKLIITTTSGKLIADIPLSHFPTNEGVMCGFVKNAPITEKVNNDLSR